MITKPEGNGKIIPQEHNCTSKVSSLFAQIVTIPPEFSGGKKHFLSFPKLTRERPNEKDSLPMKNIRLWSWTEHRDIRGTSHYDLDSWVISTRPARDHGWKFTLLSKNKNLNVESLLAMLLCSYTSVMKVSKESVDPLKRESWFSVIGNLFGVSRENGACFPHTQDTLESLAFLGRL